MARVVWVTSDKEHGDPWVEVDPERGDSSASSIAEVAEGAGRRGDSAGSERGLEEMRLAGTDLGDIIESRIAVALSDIDRDRERSDVAPL